ncbi:Nif11-like leader peptide family natural product precursor [Anaerovibrio sp.]|uniref:Nif11-like leader peptide family natural product precursor n=1 Tax=Anaerovibrio sp. TaxID=1872532 RepID=UPI003F18109C
MLDDVLKGKLEQLNGKLETDEKFRNQLLNCDSMEKIIAVLAENGLSVEKDELLSLASGLNGDDEVKKLLTDDDLEGASGGVAGVDDFIVWITKKVKAFIK